MDWEALSGTISGDPLWQPLCPSWKVQTKVRNMQVYHGPRLNFIICTKIFKCYISECFLKSLLWNGIEVKIFWIILFHCDNESSARHFLFYKKRYKRKRKLCQLLGYLSFFRAMSLICLVPTRLCCRPI